MTYKYTAIIRVAVDLFIVYALKVVKSALDICIPSLSGELDTFFGQFMNTTQMISESVSA